MTVNLEIWNIAIASVLLMLVYAANISAFDMLNASLDDSNTTLTSKLGYECSSINSFISIAGSFVVPEKFVWRKCVLFKGNGFCFKKIRYLPDDTSFC